MLGIIHAETECLFHINGVAKDGCGSITDKQLSVKNILITAFQAIYKIFINYCRA